MKLKIGAIAVHLPERVEGLETLALENPDWDVPRVLEKTGIRSRRIAAPEETAADLAFAAGNALLGNAVGRDEIDLLILVTQSPDYLLPTSACILQDRLGLSKRCMAFDINLGCSGFVYALSVAGGLMDSGVTRKGLILCSDTYSKYIAKDDRACRPIFSDGAAAVLVEPSEYDSLGPFEFGTDGSGYDRLIVRSSAARNWHGSTRGTIPRLEMDGGSVFMFTMSAVPECVSSLLHRAGLSLADIRLVVFHQASKFVIDNLVRRMSLEETQVYRNYESIGNTVSATIPIALKEAAEEGRMSPGDRLLLVGFGVGLSWGATILRWEAV